MGRVWHLSIKEMRINMCCEFTTRLTSWNAYSEVFRKAKKLHPAKFWTILQLKILNACQKIILVRILWLLLFYDVTKLILCLHSFSLNTERRFLSIAVEIAEREKKTNKKASRDPKIRERIVHDKTEVMYIKKIYRICIVYMMMRLRHTWISTVDSQHEKPKKIQPELNQQQHRRV